MKKSFKFILIIISLLVLAGIITGLYLYNLKSKDLQKVKPDFVMTASDLLLEFESDENAAAMKYVDKILEVTGSIKNIEYVENNSINISLDAGSEFSSVICTFQGNSDPGKFNIGDTIKIRGQCSGYLMDVLLNNCVFVQ
jgi:hypothetical protein